MFNGTLDGTTQTHTASAESTPSLEHSSGKVIQCRQCSEHFDKNTVYCPRCHCWNDRSLLTLALRIFAAVIFLAAVSWTVRTILKADRAPAANGRLQPMPKSSPSNANQPELRF
jgi:hypothetical protein